MRNWQTIAIVTSLLSVLLLAGTAAAVVTLPLTIVDMKTNGTNVGWFHKVPQAQYINFLDGAFYNTSSKALEIGGLLDVGPTVLPGVVTAATSITAPTGGNLFHVTGATSVATIVTPFGTRTGCITMIADTGFATTTAGNIAKVSTVAQFQALTECYDPATVKWYPNL